MSSYNVITIPDVGSKQSLTWGLMRFDGQFTSPLNGEVQTIRRGARWHTDISWHNLRVNELQELSVFFAQMADKKNVALITNYGYQMQGAGGGSPKFQSIGADYSHIVTNGWPASTLVLKTGDMLQLSNDILLQVVDDVTSDGSGASTIHVAPEVRKAPTAGTAITLTAPSCYMQLKTQGFSSTVSAPALGDLSASFIEVVT